MSKESPIPGEDESKTDAGVAVAPGRTSINRGLLLVLSILILLVAVKLLVPALIQDRIAYGPRRYLNRPTVTTLPGSGFEKYTAADGREQWGFRITAPANGMKPAEGLPQFYIVLYGSGSIATEWVLMCSALAVKTGCSFFIVEYRGFGFNDGNPSRRGVTNDAIGAYDTLKAQGALDDGVGVIAHSLGTGVTLALAEARPVDSMILASSATSLREAAWHSRPWPIAMLAREDWPTERRLRKLMNRPPAERPRFIALLHGERDRGIPADMSRRLAAIAPDEIQLRIYDEANHNDIFDFAQDDIEQLIRDGTF